MNILFIDRGIANYAEILQAWTKWANLTANWFFASTSDEARAILSQKSVCLILMGGHIRTSAGGMLQGKELLLEFRARGIEIPVCMFSNERQNGYGLFSGAKFAIDRESFIKGYENRDEKKTDPKAAEAMNRLTEIVSAEIPVSVQNAH